METLALVVIIVTALFAGMISVELGISVALLELILGVVIRNIFHVSAVPSLEFFAGFAGLLLTFLAGTEVDLKILKKNFRSSVVLGAMSFLAPFTATLLIAHFIAHWPLKATIITATALSNTSLAVVYAVLVERGFSGTVLGKTMMSVTFLNNCVIAVLISFIFFKPGVMFAAFFIASILAVVFVPKTIPLFFGRYGNRIIEPEIKLVLALLSALMLVAGFAGTNAVLPVFVLGLLLSGHYAKHRKEQERLRVTAFSFLTPFFFIFSGMRVNASEVMVSVPLLLLFLSGKTISKFLTNMVFGKAFEDNKVYVSLILSTGLTFGVIAAAFGLSAGFIDEAKFSLIIAVEVISAILPTIIAQRYFEPKVRR
jgi:Kef-type K+ transport system membrane component KefB